MSKEKVINSIVTAQAELNKALIDLKEIPNLDPKAINFATHAISNFLTVIDGTCQLLLATLAEHPDPQIRIWLEGLQQATSLMNNIVAELTHHTNIKSTGSLLKFEKVDLPRLVQRACEYYQQRAGSANLRIFFESDTKQPFVRTDRVAVAAVMDNLLSNAVKFSPSGKQITVTVSEEAGSLVCSVKDEGPGLSLVDQAQLFQRGRRLSSVPKEKETSQGYGLSVAKALIELLQGEIWCESKLGNGAIFKFRLPVWQEDD